MSLFKKDDPTFSADALDANKQWAYYISSFGMREATEGIPAARIRLPYLRRNLPSNQLSEEELNKAFLPAWSEEGLIARINPENYRIVFIDRWTADRWLHRPQVQVRGLKKMSEGTKERKKKMRDKFDRNSAWMKDMSQSEVDGLLEDFQTALKEGFHNPAAPDGEQDHEQQAHDEAMDRS